MTIKRIYKSIALLMLAAAPLTAGADNKTGYLPEIGISGREVVKNNREVELKMTVDLSRLRINRQHTVAITPVIVAADGSREVAFAPVVVDGKTRSRIYLRARSLGSMGLPAYHDGSAVAVIRRRNGSEQTYDYRDAVPYERWMLGARIELREDVHGCAGCNEGRGELPLDGNVLPPFIPDYRVSTIEPEPEPVKVRAETRTARLSFRQDSYVIRPEYKNNRAELDTVSSSIGLVKSNPDVTITGIFITGYASPEGSVAHNLKLSENRARALANYISRHDAVAKGMLHVDWKGEDWEGLRDTVARMSALLKAQEVLDIIDNCDGDRDVCEQQLRNLVPPTIYERLLNEVYPALRRNEYRIEYNVRNFDLEEARRMINERPDLLSLTEMYKVAGSYPETSAEYNHVMEVAARYFPDSPAVLSRRSAEAIAAKDYAAAVAILEKSSATLNNATLLNNLGVALAGAGRYDEALTALDRAVKAGSDSARHNLEQLKGVTDQL